MPFNVLLLPLLGGFIFVRYWNRTKYHAIRAEKERILLLAAAAGLIALGLSFAIKAALGGLFPCSEYPDLPCFPTIWYRFIPFPYSAVSVLALMLGATMWAPLNKGLYKWFKDLFSVDSWKEVGVGFRRVFRTGWNEPHEIDRVLYADGDPLDMLLRVAEKESKTVQATLKSGKVYVGFVSGTNPPSSPTRSIGIVPTKSGYRDPVSKEVRYQIYYSDALTRLNEDIDALLEQYNAERTTRKNLLKDERLKQKEIDQLKVSVSAGAERQKQIDKLDADIQALHEQVISASKRANKLFQEMEDLGDVINDFQLVFPIAEVSTISIYREEVKLEYFSQMPAPDPATPDSTQESAPSH